MEFFTPRSREFCTVRRERTNTPMQALVTLNDPQFVEAARHLAEIAMRKGGPTVEGRIEVMARRLLARPLRDAELRVTIKMFDDFLAHYQSHPDDARELIAVGESRPDASQDAATLAAWTM